MMRVWASMVLLLALAPSISSAESLVLWHSYRGTEEQALNEVLERYREHNPRAPEVEALALPYDVLASKLTTAIPRGHGPDLFIFAHERAGGWADAGIIEALDPSVSPEEIDSFFATTVFLATLGAALAGAVATFLAGFLATLGTVLGAGGGGGGALAAAAFAILASAASIFLPIVAI